MHYSVAPDISEEQLFFQFQCLSQLWYSTYDKMKPTPIEWNLYERDIKELYKTGRAEDIVIWLKQEKGVQCK